jgi:ribokinase
LAVDLTVVGSINLDLVLQVERLPRPGETVSGREFSRFPGGKGANQAVAAARLGARVRLVGAVGDDDFAGPALEGLRGAEVELELEHAGQTGIALIYVDEEGETEIAVFPGANAAVPPRAVEGAVLCQLEIPDEVVLAAAERASFFVLNAAPVRPLDIEPDLLVVNELEAEVMSRGKLVAVTSGARGAVLYERGKLVAEASPPAVEAIDGTAAGDAFTACLVVSLLEGLGHEPALRRACAAGAYAASVLGAQTSLPTAAELAAFTG